MVSSRDTGFGCVGCFAFVKPGQNARYSYYFQNIIQVQSKVENRFQHCRTLMAGASRFSMEVTRTPTDILLRRLVEKRRKEAHVEKMIMSNRAKELGKNHLSLQSNITHDSHLCIGLGAKRCAKDLTV